MGLFNIDYYSACEKEPYDATNSPDKLRLNSTSNDDTIKDSLLNEDLEGTKWTSDPEDATPSITVSTPTEEVEVMSVTFTVDGAESVKLEIGGETEVHLASLLSLFDKT